MPGKMIGRIRRLMAAFAVCVSVAASVVVSVLVAPPAGAADGLASGQTLTAGNSLYSARGWYRLTMQSDGNLVLYDNGGGAARWWTGTGGAGNYAIMQTDGNLVVYNSGGTVALWPPASVFGAGNTLKLQDDGNLVIYRTNGSAAWSRGAEPSYITVGTITSGTSLISGGGYRATMQSDGNLVVYNSSNVAMWTTGTGGYPGAQLVYQADGNAVVYNTGGTAVWTSNTGGLPAGRFELGLDGNLVVYANEGSALWSSLYGATQPFTDNMRPTANLPGACYNGDRYNGTFCQTDNNEVSVWADTSYGQISSTGASNIHATTDNDYDATDLNITWVSTPVYSGSSETDIIYLKTTLIPEDGQTWCDDAVTALACDQHYVAFADPNGQPTRGLACHESGHAVGLTHGQNAYPAVDQQDYRLRCMRKSVTSLDSLGIYNMITLTNTY